MKYLLIDLDDTLLDFTAGERRALVSAMRVFGRELTERETKRYSEINLSMWKRLERGEITRSDVKIERFRVFLAEIGCPAPLESVRNEYESRLARQGIVIDGAEEFLREASRRYNVYAITNGTAHIQRQRLQLSGLEPYFSGVFISETIGFNKPDPRFFAAVKAAIEGFSEDEALLVGDSPSSDIAGGKAAGIRTCLYDPRGNGKGEADYSVQTLDGILPLLFRLEKEAQGRKNA